MVIKVVVALCMSVVDGWIVLSPHSVPFVTTNEIIHFVQVFFEWSSLYNLVRLERRQADHVRISSRTLAKKGGSAETCRQFLIFFVFFNCLFPC
jgi:hypothetical protein